MRSAGTSVFARTSEKAILAKKSASLGTPPNTRPALIFACLTRRLAHTRARRKVSGFAKMNTSSFLL